MPVKSLESTREVSKLPMKISTFVFFDLSRFPTRITCEVRHVLNVNRKSPVPTAELYPLVVSRMDKA